MVRVSFGGHTDKIHKPGRIGNMRHTDLDDRKTGYSNTPRVLMNSEDLARKVLEVRANQTAHETRRTFRERNERVNALIDSGVSFRYLEHGRYCDQTTCPIVCVGTDRDTLKQCKRPIDSNQDCVGGYPLYPTMRGLCDHHQMITYNEHVDASPTGDLLRHYRSGWEYVNV